MERAKPHELRNHAVPILTARITEAELVKWFPIRFDEINDPLEAAEPSRSALVKLNNGSYVVLTYGNDSGQLTIELPETTKNPTDLLAALFEEAPLPRSRVLWHRADTQLPRNARSGSGRQRSTTSSKKSVTPQTSRQRTKRSALRASLPKKTK